MFNHYQKLKNHPGFLRYFKNISWLFIEKLTRVMLGVFVGIWVARYLGPVSYGLYNYVLSFVGLFVVFSSVGLDGILTRELVKDASHLNVLLGTSFVLKLVGSLVALAMLFLAITLTSNDQYTNVLITIVAGSILLQSFNIIDFYFQSIVSSRYIVFANLISMITTSVLRIGLIMMDASLVAFVWVTLIENFILMLGFIFFYTKNRGSIVRWKFDKKIALFLLKESWPLLLSGFVISIHLKIDQIMLKEMLGSEAVGQYAAAVRISEVWYFIPMAIASSVFPAIINAKLQSIDLYYIRLQKLFEMFIWMAITIAVPVTLLAPWIIQILYGEAYFQSSHILTLHIWAGVFVFFGTARHKWVLLQGLQRYEIMLDLAGALVNICLNYLLIPIYGILGAVYATLFSYFLGSVGFTIFLKEFHMVLIMFFKSFLLPLRIIKGKY